MHFHLSSLYSTINSCCSLHKQKYLIVELDFYSPQNLNARKAEFLVGLSNLKSAASSVAKKIDEIKGAIGAGVAVTPSKLSGSGM